MTTYREFKLRNGRTRILFSNSTGHGTCVFDYRALGRNSLQTLSTTLLIHCDGEA